MFSKNSWVYWVFRIYALGGLASVAVHAIAVMTGERELHRLGFRLSLAAYGLGCLPALAALACEWLPKCRTRGRDT